MEAKIINFLHSDENESEYFGVSKENTITLEEYHDRLRALDGSFRYHANSEVTFMKRKLDWVDEVGFYGLQISIGDIWKHTCINIFTKDGEEISAHLNPETGLYEAENKNIPKICLVSKRVRTRLQRQEELGKVQRELEEIEKIAKETYDNQLNFKKSVSSNFEITYRPSIVMDVWYESDYDHELVSSVYENSDRRRIDVPYLSESSNRKILRKILVKEDK